MNRLEALTDGLCRMTEFSDPTSTLYRYRNPLGLRVFCIHGKGIGRCDVCPTGHPLIGRIWRDRDWDRTTSLRIFGNFLDGYRAALFDVGKKCSGESHAKITQTSTLADLCVSYAIAGTRPSDALAKFLRRALDDDRIRPDTMVSFFTVSNGDSNGG